MDFLLRNPHAKNIITFPSIEPLHKKYIIAVATGTTLRGPFGVILSQQIDYDIFTFRYYVMLIDKVTGLYTDSLSLLLPLTFMLENHVTTTLTGKISVIMLGLPIRIILLRCLKKGLGYRRWGLGRSGGREAGAHHAANINVMIILFYILFNSPVAACFPASPPLYQLLYHQFPTLEP